MSGTRLSIVTPTQGRATLERMILSAVDQLDDGDEWIIVVDTAGMDPAQYERIVARVAGFPRCRVIPHDAGRHTHGHDQLNHGMAQATGDWLAFNDDDDIFLPGAFAAIREAIAELPSPRPLLCRFVAPWGQVLWTPQDRALGIIREGGIGGHCLVAPNVPDRLGTWTPRYAGDFDMIETTINLWDRQIGWVDAVIAKTRPQ